MLQGEKFDANGNLTNEETRRYLAKWLVITSYSIHYTKLYDFVVSVVAISYYLIGIVAKLLEGMASYVPAFDAKLASLFSIPVVVLLVCVITSYSIHYTKLYDSRFPVS